MQQSSPSLAARVWCVPYSLSLSRLLAGAAREGLRIVDCDAVVRVHRQVAAPLEEGDGLVDAHPRGAHQGRQVALRQGQGDQGAPTRDLLAVFPGEG